MAKDNLPTAEEALAELRRELSLRKKLYPGWIFNNKLKKEVAELQIARLEKAIELIDGLLPKQTTIF